MAPAQPTSAPGARTCAERSAASDTCSGFVGVASFSLTLPATRVAVAALDPVFVGLGRAVVAALLAAVVLAAIARHGPGGRCCRGSRSSPAASSSASRCSRPGRCVTCPPRTARSSSGCCRSRRRWPARWIAHERPSRRSGRARVRQRRRRRLRALAGRRRAAARRRPARPRGRRGRHRLRGRRPARAHARRLAGDLLGARPRRAVRRDADGARHRRARARGTGLGVGRVRLRQRRQHVSRLLRLVSRARARRDRRRGPGAAPPAVPDDLRVGVAAGRAHRRRDVRRRRRSSSRRSPWAAAVAEGDPRPACAHWLYLRVAREETAWP